MKALEKLLYKLGLIKVKRVMKFISSVLSAAATVHAEDLNEIKRLKIDMAIYRSELQRYKEEVDILKSPTAIAETGRSKKAPKKSKKDSK